ncbi:MAG TPA: hypothetical protein ENI23_17695 [bacterium]|nr:hypothetical protein [bacterium]
MIGIPPKGWSTEKFQQALKGRGIEISAYFSKYTNTAFFNSKDTSRKKKAAIDLNLVMIPYETIVELITGVETKDLALEK